MSFHPQKRTSFLIIGIFFLTNLLLLFLIKGLQASTQTPSDLAGSQKLVDQATAHLGDTLVYTIIVSNSSATSVTASLIDYLPTGLIYQPETLTATIGTAASAEGNIIIWDGSLSGHAMATIAFATTISSGLSVGSAVVNTAVITSNAQTITRTATTFIVNSQIYLPFIQRGLTTQTLNPIQLTCNSDSWTVSWNNNDTGVTYELQESHTADFATPTIYTTMNSFQPINNPPSPDNIYYYRVRSSNGAMTSAWSDSISVVGNFFDGFADTASGWAEGENSISVVGYDNNEYFVRTKDTGIPNVVFLASSFSPDVSRSNYIVEADMHWQSGATTAGLYGLIFGANADGSQYYFVALFSDSQEFQIFFFDSTLPFADRLQPVSPRLSEPLIQPGTAVHHVLVERVGENIALQINGVSLGSWMDNSLLGSTRAGLIAAANPAIDPVVEARYDNFKLSACPGPTAVSPSSFIMTAVSPAQIQPLPSEALFANHR